MERLEGIERHTTRVKHPPTSSRHRMQRRVTYSPDIFNVGTVEDAKRLILTTEQGVPSEERWAKETPHLLDLIGQKMNLSSSSTVLDYGCGIGRMSKALIGRYGCLVVGADISPSMRAFSATYVGDDRFLACAPAALTRLGVRFDAAIAVWVLQHCLAPERDIALMRSLMAPGARLFVVNQHLRVVPTTQRGWADDGKDVKALLASSFGQVEEGTMDPGVVTEPIAKLSYWALCSAFQNDPLVPAKAGT
jgi:SAM-dependent methyltransferase